MELKYELELFDSRNTSFRSRLPEARLRSQAIRAAVARSKSGDYHHVVLHDNATGAWAKYEKGFKTEWSIQDIK